MKIFEAAPPSEGPSLALHGGAGGRVEELSLEGRAPYAEGLQAAFSTGWQVLASGGSALIELQIDPEAINPRTTLSAIRAEAQK